jgi:hypothetical protein
MPISRRQFLASAATAIMVPRLDALGPSRQASIARCSVVDLGADCTLRESVAGYHAQVLPTPARVPVLIVPAALSIPRVAIEGCLRVGGTVIFESGVAFADRSRFRAHAHTVREALGIRIEPPVDLWPRHAPYVDFTWPAAFKVRDFSRLLPLSEQFGEVIATADGHAAAIRRSLSGGTLVFLGTPLGPALWAGDEQARQWLCAVARA